MYIPVRRTFSLVLSVSALLGPLTAKGQTPFRPGGVNLALLNPILSPASRLNLALGMSLNPYVNPFASSALVGSRFGLN
jgi:hypothetical protein